MQALVIKAPGGWPWSAEILNRSVERRRASA